MHFSTLSRSSVSYYFKKADCPMLTILSTNLVCSCILLNSLLNSSVGSKLVVFLLNFHFISFSIFRGLISYTITLYAQCMVFLIKLPSMLRQK